MGQRIPVVKADSTHTGGTGSISWHSLSDRIDVQMGL